LNLNKVTFPLLFWLEWTIFHLFLISIVEDLATRIALVILYVWVMIGIIVMGRIEYEGKKNL